MNNNLTPISDKPDFMTATVSLITNGKGAMRGIDEVLQALEEHKIITIAEYRRHDIKIGHVICLAIAKLQEQIGVSHKLDQDDIVTCATELVDEYPWLTVYDIANVFKAARRGHYGNLYERLSQPKIFEWFNRYADERFAAAEQRSIQRHELCRIDSHDIASRHEVLQWYQQQITNGNNVNNESNVNNVTNVNNESNANNANLQAERQRQLQQLASLYPEILANNDARQTS